MVLFKLILIFGLLIQLILLHSTMVLFKYIAGEGEGKDRTFYIPLWFYSNRVNHQMVAAIHIFTFHYGSIQMLTVTG